MMRASSLPDVHDGKRVENAEDGKSMISKGEWRIGTYASTYFQPRPGHGRALRSALARRVSAGSGKL